MIHDLYFIWKIEDKIYIDTHSFFFKQGCNNIIFLRSISNKVYNFQWIVKYGLKKKELCFEKMFELSYKTVMFLRGSTLVSMEFVRMISTRV